MSQPASPPVHRPVLVDPFLALGFPEEGTIFVDATFGLGGHTRALLSRFPRLERVIGLDRDGEILDWARREWAAEPRVVLVHERFSRLPAVLAGMGIAAVDGILLDLGVSSWQLEEPGRGFSFSRPGPLDMRMDRRTEGPTARDLVNTLPEEELARLFAEFGEERFARRIAQAIVRRRTTAAFTTTADLAALIEGAIPARLRATSPIHPATRVFQALRIAVNDELTELEQALTKAIDLLRPDGRLTVISFHSLEDRRVKQAMAMAARGCRCPPRFPVCTCGQQPTVELLTRKPIGPTPAEQAANPRCRSARLRVARRLPPAPAREGSASSGRPPATREVAPARRERARRPSRPDGSLWPGTPENDA
ncbi:MAG: rRNA small subunit methyltransferase H [Candidatus Ozemobacter sibiricus]|jgi:16S rRNA (cytosine1402-N4)-methyltransferase|uniref:Ribosomal RNA small subunit methyltransferase H n=1 Tax=Candidatus Ozemobacter sibiricus TaxID=2268124 RepID=A0A367ZUD6_9BACT|nr:MAG: rRNA small subunit methyltransferase H [Candidatus Ozemobacter sibiricus]